MTTQEAFDRGFIKRAEELVKSAESDKLRERARLNPLSAAGAASLGILGSTVYGHAKEKDVSKLKTIQKARKDAMNIDKGKAFSWKRGGAFVKTMPGDAINRSVLKHMLGLGVVGAGAGGALSAMNDGDMTPTAIGGLSGVLAGMPVGGYRAATAFNKKYIDKK